MNQLKGLRGLFLLFCLPFMAGAEAPPASLEIPVKPDVPSGYPDRVGRFATPLRQDLTSLQLTSLGQGRYGLRFSSGTETPALPDIDLRPFIPRVPLLAKGNAELTRIALIQRELNRNQTRYPAPGRPETVFVANNCLKSGLWEIGLDRKDDQGSLTYYHGWFTFPKTEYARLFETLNGIPYSVDLENYPKLDGLPVPLESLRSVVRDIPVPVDTHSGEPIDQFSEQARKAKLVLAPAVRTYGDWPAADRQPVALAKFSEPGFYDAKDPVRFDLAWLAQPAEARWRWVKNPQISEGFPEIELRYKNGHRILLASDHLTGLPARTAKPGDEADLLHLTFGIGTPEIYSNVEERIRELETERQNYLLLLDGSGNLVDNHRAGVDRIYLWREAGDPGRLHLYLVSYERIALVSHLSLPWSGATPKPPEPAAR